MFDILYYRRRSVNWLIMHAMILTSKFWDAARGLVRRRLQPLPVSTHILYRIITDKGPIIGVYSLSTCTTNG